MLVIKSFILAQGLLYLCDIRSLLTEIYFSLKCYNEGSCLLSSAEINVYLHEWLIEVEQ